MTFDDAINLHAAAFMASCSRLALMLQDKSHLNPDSREWKQEFEVADYHRRQAFLAKNAKHEAERTVSKAEGAD